MFAASPVLTPSRQSVRSVASSAMSLYRASLTSLLISLHSRASAEGTMSLIVLVIRLEVSELAAPEADELELAPAAESVVASTRPAILLSILQAYRLLAVLPRTSWLTVLPLLMAQQWILEVESAIFDRWSGSIALVNFLVAALRTLILEVRVVLFSVALLVWTALSIDRSSRALMPLLLVPMATPIS